MLKLISYFSLIALGFLLFSCDPETPEPVPSVPSDPELVIKFALKHNGEIVELDQTLTTDEGYPFQIKEVKIFVSQLASNGNIFSDVSKLDLAANGNVLSKRYGKSGDFENLSGWIGVVQPWNNADPVSFDPSSPLYLSNANDMHWGWNPGYIFYKFEGLFSPTVGSTNLNEIFTYHMGFNEYLRSLSLNNLEWTKINDNRYEFYVYLHVDELFNGPGGVIDLATEPFTHATPDKAELNEKIVENFAAAFRNE